jgi:hypothetical protein
MDTLSELQQQRKHLMQQMMEITCVRKGTISEQYVPARKDGKATERLLGPYWVVSTKKNGKTISERLKTQQDVEQAREEISNHKRLSELFHQFEEFTERMSALLREASVSEEALKKGLKSKSKKTRKSLE